MNPRHAPSPSRPIDARRRLLGALLGLPWLAACAVLDGPQAARAAVASSIERPEPQRVAEGVWLLRGHAGDVDPANAGRIGNAALLVGPRGALLVNAGVSRRDGEALLARVRQLTDQPLRGLLLTHAMQEFIFGATAFQDAGVPVWMHRDAARLMSARCETCLKSLQRQLGEAEMAGTRVPRPDHLFDARDADASLAPLPDIGRPLRLLAPMAGDLAASPGDSALWDVRSASLVAGALLDSQVIPDVQDGDLKGWRLALEAASRLGPHQALPGHGPAGDAAELIGRERRYLDQLEARTAELLRGGIALSEVADASGLPEFAGWARSDTTHRRNASIVYLRQERALMLGR
ncbi:MBL fold metallo-hydrolase [Leptothrix discophora]|uniref:MBL fold metallo-hydrolase n=1 Tax=Leptothrix discophora TaxID=89 RepID=A0ABT9G8E4_LEPDI|nr:MBL fold metallo-hydrolase [Leptothrix discophora]MDP4302759.1 MBL fold metallo-hydrolase [Leptothrix discophora]